MSGLALLIIATIVGATAVALVLAVRGVLADARAVSRSVRHLQARLRPELDVLAHERAAAQARLERVSDRRPGPPTGQ